MQSLPQADDNLHQWPALEAHERTPHSQRRSVLSLSQAGLCGQSGFHVEFRSGKFASLPGEEQRINPGRWGRRLADYLRQQLQATGIATEEPGAEDWGWIVPIVHEPFSMWIGCGNYEEHEDAFLCFIEPSKPSVFRWVRRHDTRDAVARIAEALDQILRSDPDIRDVQWWNDEASV